MNDKTIIIINGQGGVGKDTLCNYFCKFYNGMIISVINPVKQKAKRLGWKGGKTDKDRAFLNELKHVLDSYFNETDVYLDKMLRSFEAGERKVLFVTMRDIDDIEKYKAIFLKKGFRVKTLLVRRKAVQRTFGNPADDNVFDYGYDYIFDNDMPIEAAHNDFVILIKHAVFDVNE